MARISQIIEASQIVSLQKRLTNSLEMSVVFEEPNGSLLNVIGQRGGICKVCSEFIDKEETGRRRCLLADSEAASKAQGKLLPHRSQDVVVEFYVCDGNFRNFVIPISIGGEVVGNVFSGQFLVETLTKGDPEFDVLLDRMRELGVTREQALIYASLPEEDAILQVARDNNIPTEQWQDFQAAYKEMFKSAKPLSHVIDAVYLVSEIAQTLSSLGSAYYYNDICTKLTLLVPDELRPFLTDNLNELSRLVQAIRAHPRVELSTEITAANQLVYQLLSTVESHESAYVEKLLSPYKEDLAPITPNISELEKRLLIARLKYDSQKARTILNRALRDKTISPRMYSDEDKELFDVCDLQLKEVEEVLSKNSAQILEYIDPESGTPQLSTVDGINNKLMDLGSTVEARKPSLDDIENLLVIISSADFGLQRIKSKLCGERVMNELPPPLAELRQKLGLGYDIVYLNWGSISSTSNSVTRELNLCASEMDRHGPVSVFTEKKLESATIPENILSSVRGTVASLIKCKTDEVVLTHNTTHGVTLALSSIDFSPKGGKDPDRIIVTDCEHDTIFHCIEQVERKFNVKHECLNLSENSSTTSIVNNIVSQSSDNKTKVVIVSHITFNTGQVLDIADIIKEVRNRLADKAPLFLVDGAQAVGHIPVDVSSLNCDFYAADAHKWLMGPRGSGFLYVNESYLEKRSDQFGFYESYMVADRYKPRNEKRNRLYEPATMSVETYVGMKNAIETVLDAYCKYPEMYERVISLSQTFRQKMEDELKPYGVKLVNHEAESGLVAVAFSGQDNFELYSKIRRSLDERFHILSRALDNPPCLRFSISYLNSEWEITFALKCLGKVLEEIPELATAKAEVDEEQSFLEEQKDAVAGNIKGLFAEAGVVLKARLDESKIKGIDINTIREGNQIYAETEANLERKKQELLGRVQRSVSAEELKEIEKTAAQEINLMIYGKHD